MRPAIVAIAVLWGTTALGTTLLYRDVPDLSRTSDAVVRGKVVDTQSRWSSDGRRIFTDVTIAVQETLKGEPAKTVVIIQPGGQVGDIGQKVSGLAGFTPGEEVVVFLERRGDSRFIVNGMAQGKYRIERSTDGKAAYAVPDRAAEEANVLDPITRAPTHIARPTLKLEVLRQDIRRALASPDLKQLPVQKAPTGAEVK